MATFWDALIWWWYGRMEQAPAPAINPQGGQGQGQQQVVPAGQILPQAPGVNGGNQNFLIFAFQEIVNYSPVFFLIRGVDIAGDFVNERMSGSDRNGYAASRLWTTRTNENTRAPLLPVFLSIYSARWKSYDLT